MRTALTVITTAILTAIAFLLAWQQGFLWSVASAWISECPTIDVGSEGNENCIDIEEGASCTTPWDTTIEHGEAVLSFENEVASGDATCKGMTSICNNGSWLNDKAPYAFESCELEATALSPDNCVVGDIMVAHDSTNTFYKEIRNGSTYTYQSQTRYCFDGEMDGDSDFNKLNLISSCTLQVEETENTWEIENTWETQGTVEPAVETNTAPQVNNTPTQNQPIYARCTGPFGGVWTHGQQGSVYLQSSVPYGSSCQQVGVVCGYGSIRYGTAENIGEPVGEEVFASCEVQEPVSCSSACGDVAHGESVTTYTNWSIPHGSDTTCSDVEVTSTCSNGSLSPNAGSACSCEVQPPAWCIAPNGQRIAHGGSITLYKDETIQPVAWDGSDTCVRQGGKCENGVFFDWNGNPTTLTFQYSSCTILPPPAWEGPGGEWVPQG